MPRDSRENAVQICPICKFQATTKNPYRHLQVRLPGQYFLHNNSLRKKNCWLYRNIFVVYRMWRYRKTLVWIRNNMFLIWTGILPSMSSVIPDLDILPSHQDPTLKQGHVKTWTFLCVRTYIIERKQILQCFSTLSWETYSWWNTTGITSLTTCNWLIVKLHKLYRLVQIFKSKRSDPAPDQARNRIQSILIVHTLYRYYWVLYNWYWLCLLEGFFDGPCYKVKKKVSS